MKKTILAFLILLLLFPAVFASSINLLAAVEGVDVGNVIAARLETEDGSGRVFIENNLISNPDTQVSVKIANEIICTTYFDCSKTDFFYTIDSSSSIITGPSGGAGLALLTYSHLIGKEVPNSYAISGTINSGGYIGNVGGLKEKIRAAGNLGVKNVLIPFGNSNTFDLSGINLSNSSLNISNIPKINLTKFGKEKNVQIIPVASFDDVLEEVFDIPKVEYEIVTPDFYSEIMGNISKGICSVSAGLVKTNSHVLIENYSNYYCLNSSNCSLPLMTDASYALYTNFTFYNDSATNLLNYSANAKSTGDFYASASYCFGANINLRYIEFLSLGLNDSISNANTSLSLANDVLKTKFETLNDLQVYSVVKERILDATASYDEGIILANDGKVLEAIDKLSYAYERANTAVSWSNFYNVPSSKRISGSLKDACSLALNDASSRVQYIKLYLTIPLEAEVTLQKAKDSQTENDPAMCIYYSLESKAEAEIVSSIFGANQEQINSVLDAKESIAKKFIAKQYSEGNYPLLGYSYLEYGTSLKENNPYSALLYFQMAQELSSLDIFLDVDSSLIFAKPIIPTSASSYLLIGIILGLIIAVFLYRIEFAIKKTFKK